MLMARTELKDPSSNGFFVGLPNRQLLCDSHTCPNTLLLTCVHRVCAVHVDVPLLACSTTQSLVLATNTPLCCSGLLCVVTWDVCVEAAKSLWECVCVCLMRLTTWRRNLLQACCPWLGTDTVCSSISIVRTDGIVEGRRDRSRVVGSKRHGSASQLLDVTYS